MQEASRGRVGLAHDLIRRIATHHHDRNIRVGHTDEFDRLGTTQAGHAPIDQHPIDGVACKHFDPTEAIFGNLNFDPIRLSMRWAISRTSGSSSITSTVAIVIGMAGLG